MLQEQFKDNRLNWSTGTSDGPSALEKETISGGKYIWEFTSKKDLGSFSFPDMAIKKDVYISVDLLISTTGQSNDEKAGIVFRNSDKNNSFYFFGISPNGGFSLSMYDGSSSQKKSHWSNLYKSTQTETIKPDEINHLVVSMEGNQIIMAINDQIVGSQEDSSLTSGTAGLGLNFSGGGITTKATFSNFVVRSPEK